MHSRHLLAPWMTAAALIAASSTVQAQELNFSSGADVVEIVGHGGRIAALTGSGGSANSPGFAKATINKKAPGVIYRVRIECSTDEWGSGPRSIVVSSFVRADQTRWSASVTCPSNAPYADLFATKVQAASMSYRFLCQFNDATFGDAFVSCSSFGEW